ncbi:uncharacterized protein LOC131671175 [Phymastichus coffea]|uniref:uncharacterized protein LOC131671175 n=1 Tax=Phymastichus coffea TaxID=108790 RepID=UPI00273B856B|nr:uncharacterized protein LOC131671175 [Phymastichus coffea]
MEHPEFPQFDEEEGWSYHQLTEYIFREVQHGHLHLSFLFKETYSGLMDSGIGFTNFNKLSATLNIPQIDFKTYKRYEEEVGTATERLAKQSCEKATELERKLMLENLESLRQQLPENINSCFNKSLNLEAPVTFETVVQLIASYDMGWSTRANGKNYDSLNGYGAIVGLYSQAILGFSTCNRKCKKCDNGCSPFDHDCRLSFYGSAKAMEGYAANKIVNENSILKSKNVEIGIFIGDNDSSAIAACRQGATHQISKLSDINHTSKGVKKELYGIEKNYQELKSDSIKYLHRCFTYAVAQNKGNSKNMASAVRCIPYHEFNNHDMCGQWCGFVSDRENYDHKMVPGGLKDQKLFEELKNIFDKLANNAEKFSIGASSNVNESLNASMAAKAPKSKCLSLSASSDYRFAAVVCQKNIGDCYTSNICGNLKLSPAKNHRQYIDKIIKNKVKRALFIKTQTFKKNKILLRKKKSALRHKKEQLEGTTYLSNSNLLTEPAVQDAPSLSDDEEGTLKENCPVIYFDLETSGLHTECDILQIAAKCGKISFNVYIYPVQDISAAASAIHGLRKYEGDLMLQSEKVHSVSLRIAMGQFLHYLLPFNKKCYLAAHNLNFDGPRLLNAINKCSLTDEFSKVLEGFIDTLPVIKKCTERTGKGACTITSLANWLNISSLNAHDATKDVAILEKIIKKLAISYDHLVNCGHSYVQITDKWLDDARVRRLLPTLNPLLNVVGNEIRKKLIRANITIELLKTTYFSYGITGVFDLLSEKINNKPIVTAHKPTIKKIVDWLES